MSTTERDRRENARAERIIPGIWRLRVPLAWPGVPHVNAFALTHEEGVVLVDTATGEGGDPQQLELALQQLGYSLPDVSLVVCTHSHVDHYGLAKAVVEASGAPLGLHPAWGHVRQLAEDPTAARIEVATQSGVPADVLDRYGAEDLGSSWLSGIAEPDIDLLPGTTIDSDLGKWEVHATPGHAPSHVVFHQPERRLLISGDHLLGRVSVFFPYDADPALDPVGQYLDSLDRVADLDVGLVLAGHGRPFRDANAKVGATREVVEEMMNRVRGAMAGGPATAYDILMRLIGPENASPEVTPYLLPNVLAYLQRLRVLGEAEHTDDDPPIWSLR